MSLVIPSQVHKAYWRTSILIHSHIKSRHLKLTSFIISMEDVLEISSQLMKNLIFLKAVLNFHSQDRDDAN